MIECDGQDWHHFMGDQRRDIDMLANGGVDEVFRFRGCDINFGIDFCIQTIQRFAPQLLNPECDFPSFDENLIASTVLKDKSTKPLIRNKVNYSDFSRLSNSVSNSDTCCDLGTDHFGRIIVQFKTPYWNWHREGEIVFRSVNLDDFAR